MAAAGEGGLGSCLVSSATFFSFSADCTLLINTTAGGRIAVGAAVVARRKMAVPAKEAAENAMKSFISQQSELSLSLSIRYDKVCFPCTPLTLALFYFPFYLFKIYLFLFVCFICCLGLLVAKTQTKRSGLDALKPNLILSS